MTAPDDDVVLAPIRRAILDLRRLMPSVRPATVTGVNPLRVQFDGETAPVSASPTSLVPVGPGDRVRVLHYSNTHLILGRVNTKGTPYRMAAGLAELPHNGSQYGNGEITFPPGRFTVPPLVVATASSNLFNVATGTATTTGCLIHSRTINQQGTSNVAYIRWHAIQMTPTSAEG